MDKFSVKLYAGAYRDLEGIYAYIAESLMEPATAEQMITSIEDSILSLENFPERGAVRRTGIYADRGYRQIFVKDYVIVYKVLEKEKEVHIVTIRYAPSNF